MRGAGRYRRGSKRFAKLTLRKAQDLARKFEDSISQKEKEKRQLGSLREAEKKLEQITASISELRQKISREKQNLVPKAGMISSLLGRKELSPRSVIAVSELEAMLNGLHQDYHDLLHGVINKHSLIERAIGYDKKALADLKPHLERLEKKEGALVALKNRAATNNLEKRVIGAVVKKRIPKSKNCPYCDVLLGDSSHADHIIPVALGGLSTPSNMVYVSASCNAKKSDKTLREFINKFGLDRELIEQRLEVLGKRF